MANQWLPSFDYGLKYLFDWSLYFLLLFFLLGCWIHFFHFLLLQHFFLLAFILLPDPNVVLHLLHVLLGLIKEHLWVFSFEEVKYCLVLEVDDPFLLGVFNEGYENFFDGIFNLFFNGGKEHIFEVWGVEFWVLVLLDEILLIDSGGFYAIFEDSSEI